MGSAISYLVVRHKLDKIYNSPSDVTDLSNINWNLLKNVILDIAITGESGAGKSSFVNAWRGMTDFEKDSAPVGITETTMMVKGYRHPKFPKVTIWDLPGIGIPGFDPKEYLQKVKFEKYDFFIILAFERFTNNDVQLAREIHKMKKKFYYVRSKMDVSMENERSRPNFNEEETLKMVRENCCDKLKEAGESNPRVFLITRKDLNMYDFPLFQEALANDLDDLKRYALVTAMPNASRDILKKKKDAMKVLVWILSFVSCSIGTIPVPGLSAVCNLGILVGAMTDFCKVFDLDEDSLCRLSRRVGKPVPVLRSAIKKSRVPDKITIEFVMDLFEKSTVSDLDADALLRLAIEVGKLVPELRSAIEKSGVTKKITLEFVKDLLEKTGLCGTLKQAELVLEFLPMLNSVAGGISSFATTFNMLKTFLNDVEEDAENVLAKAAER